MSSDEQKNPEQQKASKDDGRVRAGANGLEPLWPTSVKYLKENDWDEISGSEREWFCVTRLQGVQVRFIHHDGHPCKGQRGLFAIRVWEPFEVLGEYCGVVKVPNDQEARQCDSDYAVAVYKEMKPDSSTTSEEWQAARTASFRSLTWEGGLRSLWLSQGK
mmetsp:Transcript_11246/g.38363  ORF Transcript_11246/g.38363 Transcript_11246/m.38363 type:complete len:161 (-) Transcript_11246:1595-2077(-)